MRHRVKGFKLNRHPAARTALLKGLVSQVLLHNQITTTEKKARFAQPYIEHAISQAKQNSVAMRRQLAKTISEVSILRKLFDDVAPRYSDISSGFTRITSLGRRRGDDTMMVRLSLVEGKKAEAVTEKADSKAASKSAEKATPEVSETKIETKKAAAKPKAKVATKKAEKPSKSKMTNK